jgi:hypothetical protein
MQRDAGTPAPSSRTVLRVDCLVRSERVSPYHRVRAVGGIGRDGRSWRLSEEAAIAAIENDRAAFYIERPQGHRIEIVVSQGLGKTYLKTELDGEWPDVLLTLPDCG